MCTSIVCVCVCVYVCMYIYIHTHTHARGVLIGYLKFTRVDESLLIGYLRQICFNHFPSVLSCHYFYIAPVIKLHVQLISIKQLVIACACAFICICVRVCVCVCVCLCCVFVCVFVYISKTYILVHAFRLE